MGRIRSHDIGHPYGTGYDGDRQVSSVLGESDGDVKGHTADLQTFKFLTNKPAESFASDPQFLHMLRAEEEGLITIDVHIPDDSLELFADAMYRCVEAKDYGTVATAWNKLRKEVVQGVVKDHLLPVGSKWLREHMKSEAEDYVAEHCGKQLEYVSSRKTGSAAELMASA